MNCEDIHKLAPLWHTGELDAAQRAELDVHVGSCRNCAAELREQAAEDVRLRETMAAEVVDTRAIEERTMRQIRKERLRRWLVAGTAAAAVVVAALIVNSHRAATAVPPPAIFADAARDHRTEVVEKRQRRWRTEPADLAALEASQGISPDDVRAIEATGYKLQRAKICRLGGTPYMHAVYTKGGREFSVYLRVRGAQAVAETESSTSGLQLASFARGALQAVIVTDAPQGECAKFARTAEDAL